MARITLTRHLARRAAAPIAAAAAAITLVVWALQVVRLAPEVITGATPAGAIARVLLLPLASAAAFALPLAAAVGILAAGRACRRDGTLDALAASGIAPRRTAQPFLIAGLGAVAASGALSLVAEPEALAILRDDVPVLAAAAVQGRATPGSFVAAGAGIEWFVRERRGDAFEDALLARRDPSGGAFEVFARSMAFERRASGDPVLAMRQGTVSLRGGGRRLDASFDAMSMPLDLGAVRGAVGRILPPGQTARASAIVDSRALADLDPWNRYLVLRRLAPPLETLLVVLLAAALATTGRGGARAWIVALGTLAVTFVLLRTIEPACRDGLLSPAAAVLLPHVPLAAATAGALAFAGRS